MKSYEFSKYVFVLGRGLGIEGPLGVPIHAIAKTADNY